MAVFYKWIKGCEEGANLTTGKWTYVNWTDAEPTLTIVDKDTEGTKDYGSLLTTKPSGPRTLQNTWTFEGTLACTGDIDFSTCKTFNAKRVEIDEVVAGIITSKDGTNGELQYEASKHNFKGPINNTDSYIAAKYFNATSDVRAKENVQPWDQSALDLVSQIPVYTFNYKNDQDTVIGILAQDLLEKQHENLKLVNNTDADGINEFMTIKEGKMVFVLWKAVQELQAQVADLQQQLNNLKQ